MRVYIAAPYPILNYAVALMQILADAGIECTSRWLTEDSAELTDEWAQKDLEDVARADALIALNPPQWANSGTGGRHVEFGYAIALGKPLIVIGERTHIFHHLARVCIVPTVGDALNALSAFA